jgi:hypothetical protein
MFRLITVNKKLYATVIIQIIKGISPVQTLSVGKGRDTHCVIENSFGIGHINKSIYADGFGNKQIVKSPLTP